MVRWFCLARWVDDLVHRHCLYYMLGLWENYLKINEYSMEYAHMH